jgi:hypothetical protein
MALSSEDKIKLQDLKEAVAKLKEQILKEAKTKKKS